MWSEGTENVNIRVDVSECPRSLIMVNIFFYFGAKASTNYIRLVQIILAFILILNSLSGFIPA